MSNLKEKITEKIFLPIGDLILGYSISEELIKCRNIERLSEKELNELQSLKLGEILSHATETCAAYKAIKIERNSNAVDWLNDFPVLLKSELVQNQSSYLSSKYSTKELIKLESSGSSGVKSTVYLTKKEHSILRAILINWWEWTGFYLGKPMLQTGCTPNRGIIKGIKDFLTNTVYCDAFGMDEVTAKECLNKILKKSPRHLGGFASSLYILAEIAEKNDLKVSFDGAISWGDKMFGHYKEKIESVFNTKVFENYGCNEGLMIGQKVDLDYFYIYTPNVYLELLDDNDQPVKDGTIGRVIVTKLDGYAMPLIRYDTGDLAIKLPKEEYPKERRFNFPLLKKVIGRNTDIIKTSDGKNLIVHTFTGIFEFFKEIKQFRIIQEKLESITIEYIPSEYFREDVLKDITNQIRIKTGSSIKIEWKKVKIIPPTASGKPQLIENKLIKESLAQKA